MSVSVIRYSAVCLMAVSFLSSSALADYNCTKSPDCASLGYTVNASDCDEGIKVLCPTDMSKAFCQKKLPEAPLPILYGDGTVDKKIFENKTLIGVVFDETNKLAIVLTDVKKDGLSGSETMKWSSGCSIDFCKKTKWFLPSMRDLASIYALKAQVNASLTLLSGSGAKTLTENCYWSSTERDDLDAWMFNMSNGRRSWTDKTNNDYVRPVIKY